MRRHRRRLSVLGSLNNHVTECSPGGDPPFNRLLAEVIEPLPGCGSCAHLKLRAGCCGAVLPSWHGTHPQAQVAAILIDQLTQTYKIHSAKTAYPSVDIIKRRWRFRQHNGVTFTAFSTYAREAQASPLSTRV